MEFPPSEYQHRIARARELMRERGIDALMVTGDYLYAMNYRYLSGHVPRDYQSTADRTHVLLLTAEGATIVAHWTGVAGAKATWVDDVSSYTPSLRHTDVLAAFKRLGVAKGRVGAEIGDDTRLMMPVGVYEKLKDALPGIEWVDGGALLWSLRMIKSPAEVECIRAGDRMNLAALRQVFATAGIGMGPRDIQAACSLALIQAGAIEPPYAQITFNASLGSKSGGFKLAAGDLLFVDTGCVNRGYWAEFNRMGCMGSPTAAQERMHKLTRDINRTWWEGVLKPGITAEAALLAHIAVMEKAGLTAEQIGRERLVNPPYSHHAHGIGLNSSEPPRLRLTDKTVLQAGMVINVETYVQGPEILLLVRGGRAGHGPQAARCSPKRPTSGLYMMGGGWPHARRRRHRSRTRGGQRYCTGPGRGGLVGWADVAFGGATRDRGG